MANYHSIIQGSLDIASAKLIEKQHTELTPLHLFYGLLENPQTFVSQKKPSFIKEVNEQLNKLPTTKSPISFDQIRPSADLSKWISLSSASATKDQREEILEKDLLIHLGKILPQFKIKPEDLSAQGENN